MSLCVASLWLQLRLLSRSPFFMSMSILTPVIYGTIAVMQAQHSIGGLTVRLVLGAGLLGAWSTTLYGAAESLFMQRFSGTLELLVGAPRGLFVPVLGFASATVLLGVYSVVAVWMWTSFVLRVQLDVPSVPILAGVIVVSFVGLASVGVMLAGLYVVTRQAIEITNVAEYPIWIVCGVLIPTASLWGPLQWVGRALPLGWSMAALEPRANAPWLQLGIGLALALVYLAIGALILRKVDRKARIAGTLQLR